MSDAVASERGTRAGDVLRSLAFYAVFYGLSVGYVSWALVHMLARSRGFGRAVDRWCLFHRWACRAILRIDIVIEGNVPERGVFFAVKHESFFEALDSAILVRQPVVIAKEELMRIPLWGRAARRYGLVAIDRSGGASALRRMLADTRALLATGRPLLIFPEGTRVAHGRRPPLQSGFAALYKLLALPVVPVACDSGECYHRWWKRPGTVRYRFGEPIPPGLPRPEIEARVHAAINVLNAADPP